MSVSRYHKPIVFTRCCCRAGCSGKLLEELISTCCSSQQQPQLRITHAIVHETYLQQHTSWLEMHEEEPLPNIQHPFPLALKIGWGAGATPQWRLRCPMNTCRHVNRKPQGLAWAAVLELALAHLSICVSVSGLQRHKKDLLRTLPVAYNTTTCQ